MSVRRVRENLTHGARWRREETSASRLCRAAWAPPADPTGFVVAEVGKLAWVSGFGAWVAYDLNAGSQLGEVERVV